MEIKLGMSCELRTADLILWFAESEERKEEVEVEVGSRIVVARFRKELGKTGKTGKPTGRFKLIERMR